MIRRKLDRTLLTMAVASLVVLPLAGADAGAGAGPRFEEKSDKFVLSNDAVTVWFQGKKPMLKVFPAGEEEKAYGFKFSRLVEYVDENDNGAVDEGEPVTFLTFEKVKDWSVTRAETEDMILLNLTKESPVTVAGPRASDLDLPVSGTERIMANVTLLFRIHARETLVNASGIELPVPVGAVKYDFMVNDWPWLAPEKGRLALLLDVTGNATADEEDGVESLSIEAGGAEVGLFTWTEVADGVRNGEAIEVPVRSHATSNGTGTRVTLTYDEPGVDRLVHDPTVGIASVDTGEPVDGSLGSNLLKEAPGAEAGALLAGVALAAVSWTGRRPRGP